MQVVQNQLSPLKKNKDFGFKQKKNPRKTKQKSKTKLLHAHITVVELKGLSDLTDIMIIDLAVQEE